MAASLYSWVCKLHNTNKIIAKSDRLLAAITYAHMASDVAVIYGGAGAGKSMALGHYAGNNPNVWVLESTPSCNTRGGFLRRLALLLGERIAPGHIDMLEVALLDRLRGSHGLLAIDEAQFLAPAALESGRRLSELAGIGLVLAGNETVYAQITGPRRAAEFAQLSSRIGKRVRLSRPVAADVRALLAGWQITAKDQMKLAMDIARCPGGLRAVTKMLRLATMFAHGKNEPLALAHMRAAWKDLGGNA